jgi:hypothetical protein
MDLWDVTKLMARRWYVAVPMLLLTMLAAVWVVSTVKPDYEATTNVTLLPPQLRSDLPTEQAKRVNPWDTNSLTIATVTYLENKRLHEEMEARGLSDTWESDIDIRFPSLLIIKVTADSPEKARATAQALLDGIKEEVKRQQANLNLKPGEEITTVGFDDGSNLEKATSKVKRALIVVVGVGVILTIAFTIGLDAFLRWRATRRRRKAEAAAKEPAAGAETPKTPVTPAADLPSTGKGQANGEPAPIPAHNVVPVVVPDEESSQLTQVLPRFMAYPLPGETAGAEKAKPKQQAQQTEAPAKPGAKDDASERGRIWTSTHGTPPPKDEELPSDATIVLPLSNGRGWTSKPDKR